MATTIQVSDKLWKELNDRRESSKESYEEVIWKALLEMPSKGEQK
jgi:hypothetical protein